MILILIDTRRLQIIENIFLLKKSNYFLVNNYKFRGLTLSVNNILATGVGARACPRVAEEASWYSSGEHYTSPRYSTAAHSASDFVGHRPVRFLDDNLPSIFARPCNNRLYNISISP